MCSLLEAAEAVAALLSSAQIDDASALVGKLFANGVLSVTALAALSAADLQSQYGLAASQAEALAAAAKAAALLQAAESGDAARVRELIEAKADIETVDEEGWTPLLHACSQGHEACVLPLIKAGASLSATTKDGATALSIARQKKHQAVCSLLEAAEAVAALLSSAQIDDASALVGKLFANGVLSVTALAALSAADLQSQYGLAASQAEALDAMAKLSSLLSTAHAEASRLLPKLFANGVLSVTALATRSAEELQSQYGLSTTQASNLLEKATERAAAAKLTAEEMAAAKKAVTEAAASPPSGNVAIDAPSPPEPPSHLAMQLRAEVDVASAPSKRVDALRGDVEASRSESLVLTLEMHARLTVLDDQLVEALQACDVRLVSTAWILKQPNGFRMPRLQHLEALEACGASPSPLLSPIEAVALVRRGNRAAGALSYGWLCPNDPDPAGTRMVEVRRALELHLHIEGLFWE